MWLEDGYRVLYGPTCAQQNRAAKQPRARSEAPPGRQSPALGSLQVSDICVITVVNIDLTIASVGGLVGGSGGVEGGGVLKGTNLKGSLSKN